MYKVCSNCNNKKLRIEFYRATANKDGLQPYCITCAKQHHREWRENNKEHIAAYQKRWIKSKKEELDSLRRELNIIRRRKHIM